MGIGAPEAYPKSGNSPWIQNFHDIIFPVLIMESYYVWAQTDEREREKGDVGMGASEAYPKSGNSPWIQNFHSIIFLVLIMENYYV